MNLIIPFLKFRRLVVVFDRNREINSKILIFSLELNKTVEKVNFLFFHFKLPSKIFKFFFFVNNPCLYLYFFFFNI